MMKSLFRRLYKPLARKFAPYFRKVSVQIPRLLFNPIKVDVPLYVKPGAKLLIMRHDALGDMITSLPVFKLIKDNFPNIELHVLCTPNNSIIVRDNPYIDKLHIVPITIAKKPLKHLKQIRALKKEGFDIIINCLTSSYSKNGILVNIIAQKHTVTASSFGGNNYDCYYNVQSKKAAEIINMWEKMFELIVDLFGITSPNEVLRHPYLLIKNEYEENASKTLYDVALLDKEFVVINLSVGQQRNAWPFEAYRELIESLNAEGIRTLLLWMPPEIELKNQLMQNLSESTFVYPGGRDLLEISSVIQRALWVFTPDTGIIHLASAVGSPVFVLYQDRGRILESEWWPYMVTFSYINSENGANINTIKAVDVIPKALDFHRKIQSQITGPRS